jgi:lysophospholipase L1-like esterase
MEFRTPVQIARPSFQIEPLEEILFVGSCFADSIGQRFREEHFPVIVNPFGTMYNPVSVLHSIERHLSDREREAPRIVFITLGTNHVYRLKETGEIVDNCQKRPARLFQEEMLTVSECTEYLRQIVDTLRSRRPDVQVVFTVSPIRYQKYGFHESQLSKATLLLALSSLLSPLSSLHYFPAYEILLDELRDYRFYKDDMIHPSAQAVEYIWQQLVEHYFSPRAKQFLQEWKPIKEAFGHRPFHPESEEYKRFLDANQQKEVELLARFGKTL